MNTKDKYKEALSSYNSLNSKLSEFTLDECKTLLDFELSGDNRATYVKRIHQRIVRLQNQQERNLLLGDTHAQDNKRGL